MLRNRVGDFRELHGLTQKDLGERTGVGREVIARLEAEPGYQPTMATAIRLCAYFKVDLGRMFWIDWVAVEEAAAEEPAEEERAS